jgi:serine protease
VFEHVTGAVRVPIGYKVSGPNDPRRTAVRLRTPALAAAMTIMGLAAPSAASAAACPAQSYDATGGPPTVGQPVNDPLFPRQFGLTQIKAPAAWARGAKGAGVTIAIVDSGVDLGHPDLKGKLLAGTDLVKTVPSTGVGDPGIAGPGCDGPQDENGHGTHVAGIAAADTNNGIGTAGVAPDAKILPVRVLDANGNGENAVVLQGIRWAADHGAKVINLSLGGNTVLDRTAGDTQATQDAVAYAYSKGAVVVAAAGNDSFPACDFPAAAKNTVCVGATDRNGMPAAYSNFPSDTSGVVGVRAPGGEGNPFFCEYDGDIWSTIWPGGADDCKGTGYVAGYDTLAGTSQATPFVSGVAALLSAKGLSAGQILECLRTKSSNRGSYDPAFGYGIVDADAATAQCNGSTPAFSPGGGGTGGGGGGGASHHVRVTVKKTSRKALAKSGKLQVTITSDRAANVKLKAVVRKGKTSSTGGHKTVKLKKGGVRKAVLQLSKKARAKLAKSKNATIQVSFRAGSESGVASSGP